MATINSPLAYSEPLTVSLANRILSIAPVNAAESQAVALSDQAVIYYNAYDQTNVEQIKYPTKLKESLILKAAGHPDKFEYKINIDDYLWEIAENGDILFKQKEKEERYTIKESKDNYVKAVMSTDYTDGHPVLFKIPKPFLMEARGDQNDRGEVEVKINGDTLTLRPDANWLKKHTYPIILDPTVETVPREQETVTFGDENSAEFKPKMKLNKWGDETFVSVEYEPAAADRIIQQKVVGDKVILEDQAGKVGFEFYGEEPKLIKEKKDGKETEYLINNDGGVEFNIILKEKPATNKINFKLESQGLEFYYQAPNPKAPEYINGSYAVYHQDKTGDFSQLGGKNYMAGKAFQIYRPRLTDAKGNFAWGELNIDATKGTLTVTIPQDFLDSAVYPISQAAGTNIGYTSQGSNPNGDYCQNTNGVFAELATPAVGGTVTSLSAYAMTTGGSGNLKAVVWLNSDKSIITNGVGGTVAVTSASYALKTMTYTTSPTIVISTAYWVGVVVNVNQECVAYDDSLDPHGGYGNANNNYVTPTTLTISGGTDEKYSIYATYTPNNAPTVTSVTDSPDPIGVGSKITFSLDWNDADAGEMVKGVICKGSGITTSTTACKDGEWAHSDVYTNRDPENLLTYTTVAADKGNTRNYWAFVCDDGAACSDGTAGTFTVANQIPDAPTSLLVEGREIGTAINLADTTPEFSAIYKDSLDEGDQANKMCVLVQARANSFSTGGLVGYWKIDEGTGAPVADSSGQGNNGTLAQTDHWTTSGYFDSAYNFDGTDDVAGCGTGASLAFDEGDEWTVSLWLKTSGTFIGVNGGKKMVSKATGGARAGYALVIGKLNSDGYENKIGFVIDKSPGNNYAVSTDSLPVANDDKWHQAVIVFDAKNNAKVSGTIYFDGTSYGAINSRVDRAGWATDATRAFNIGSGDGSEYFTGLVDEVSVWNRALGATEVAALYKMWDEDSALCYTGTAITAINESARSADQSYAGTALSLDGTTYYWRSWFWDDDGERGATSTTGWFRLGNSASGDGVRLKGGRLKGGVRLK